MAKFKKGDRVIVKYKDKSKPDYVGTVTKVDEDPNDPKPLQIDEYWHLSAEAESIELLTEYLELVEEAKPSEVTGTAGTEHADIGLGDITYTDIDVETLPALERIKTEPIKKTIIQKTMNAFKKALLSADTKTLIKAGYMDSETLELTSKGQQALNFIVYEKYQKELVAAADADIKEEEAKKK